MTMSNDPPMNQNPQNGSDDDDWDNVVFDDTDVPPPSMGMGRKKADSKKLIGGVAALAVVAGGAYFLFFGGNNPQNVQTPEMLAAQQQQPAPMDDVAMGGVNDSPDMDPFAETDPMFAGVTGDDRMQDPFADSVMENAMGIASSGINGGQIIPSEELVPFDQQSANHGFVDTSDFNDEIQDSTSDMQSSLVMPVNDMDLAPPTLPEDQMDPVTDMGAANGAAGLTQEEIDARLEEELIERLMASTAPPVDPSAQAENGTANANGATTATGRSTEEILIENMDRTQGAGMRTGANALQGIEANAYIRPNPQNFYIVQRESAPDQRNRNVRDARRALQEGRNDRALRLFSEIYRDNPNDTGALLGRGVALQRLNQYEEALVVYEQVLRNNPENLEALTNMLGILSMQNPEYSLDKLERLHARFSSNSAIKTQLALANGDLGRHGEALTLLQQAYNMDSYNPTVAYNLGVMYDRVGDRVRAAQYYRRALVLERESGYRGAVPVDVIQNRLAKFR